MASTTTDVVVIGSGIGGLCAAAVLADYGYGVTVVEAHSAPGGAAHGFKARAKGVEGTFHFDTGPSFFSGLSNEMQQVETSTNPLSSILRALGEEVPCHVYSTFGLLLPEGDFTHTPDFKTSTLSQVSGEQAVRQWEALEANMAPLAAAVAALPAAALRGDPGIALTTARYLPAFATIPGGPASASKMTSPFSAVLEDAGLTDPFARNWLDLLCFCLSGLPADGTITAEMAMMFGEFYKPAATMEYPIGGAKTIVNTLVKAVEARGGVGRCNARGKSLVREGDVGGRGRVVGVELESRRPREVEGGGSGEVIRARKSVISNAGTWETQDLLDASDDSDWRFRRRSELKWRETQRATPACNSFMHLHVGFSTDGISEEELRKLQCHYMFIAGWERGVDAEDNAVLLSLPSVADPSLAPQGHMVLHAYTPATERFERWEDVDPSSAEYEALKEERAAILWAAAERVVPDIRRRAVLVKVGTPLTHRRFLNVARGSYGPAIRASEGTFPPPSTPIPGLVQCGDATFPGIGVPAVAASGIIAANSAIGLETLPKHLAFLDRIHQ